MRINWVEEMVKEGSMSEAARDVIYRDCAELVKQANAATEAAAGAAQAAPTFLQQMLPNILMTVAGGAALGGAGFLGSKMISAGGRAHMTSGLVQEREHTRKAFGVDGEKAVARFDEIVELAPHVASNRPLVQKIIKAKLHSGFTDQDAMNLAMLQAQHATPKETGKARTSYEMKTAAAVGELYADMLQLTKTAGLSLSPKLKSGLKTTALLSAVPVLAGVGTGMFQHYLGKYNRKDLEARLEQSYAEAMKRSDPDQEPLHANKHEAQKAFKTLAHFAPHVAAEPSAARAFMNKMVSYNMGVDIGSIKDLTDIERNLSQVSRDPNFLQGFRAGADATGLKNIVSGSLKPTQSLIGDAVAQG